MKNRSKLHFFQNQNYAFKKSQKSDHLSHIESKGIQKHISNEPRQRERERGHIVQTTQDVHSNRRKRRINALIFTVLRRNPATPFM